MSNPEKQKEDIAFDLYLWQYTDSTSFTSMLFTLIAKADRQNKIRIQAGFPLHVEVFNEWQNSESQDLFFHKYGIVGKGLK